MNENHENGASAPGRSRSFLALAAVLLRHWKLIAGMTVLSVLAAFLVQTLRAPVYTARAVLFMAPSQGDSRASMLGAQFPGAMAGMVLGGGSPNQKLVAVVLNSRTLGEAVSKRVGPVKKQQAIAGTDGAIVVLVTDRDPKRATRVANEYGPVINERMAQISSQSTRLRLNFLRTQLGQARARLEQAENRMVSFQRGSNTIDPQEQSNRTVEAAVELQRGITAQEIAVNQLRRTATPDNPQLRRAVADLEARRDQLRRLTTGGSGNRLFVPIGRGAELKASAVRLQREFTEAQSIYASLAAMLAQTQLEGSTTLPVVNVLDPALEPRAPSGPTLPIVLALAAIMGVVLGTILVFIRDYLRGARSQPEHEEFFDAVRGFRFVRTPAVRN